MVGCLRYKERGFGVVLKRKRTGLGCGTENKQGCDGMVRRGTGLWWAVEGKKETGCGGY